MAIEQGDDLQGTHISFPLTEQEDWNYQAIAEACALYDCPDLQLVLPARKEVVRDQFFEALKQECCRAIYQYIAQQCASGISHRLPYEDWLNAWEL